MRTLFVMWSLSVVNQIWRGRKTFFFLFLFLMEGDLVTDWDDLGDQFTSSLVVFVSKMINM